MLLRVINHPGFDAFNNFDIALIELEEEIEFDENNPHIRPACLPTRAYQPGEEVNFIHKLVMSINCEQIYFKGRYYWLGRPGI